MQPFESTLVCYSCLEKPIYHCVSSENMRDGKERVEIVADSEMVHNKSNPWATFDPNRHQEFIPNEDRSLQSYSSEDGRYRAAFASRESDSYYGETEPAGLCLIHENEVVYTIIGEAIEKAIPANNGTVVAMDTDATGLFVFNPDGDMVLQEEFNSNSGTIAISPDGKYVAAATAFPDNAVHLYDAEKEQYLGRKENPSTSVIMDLEFEAAENGYVLNTYDIHPESSLADDVDPARTEVIDQIPAGPINNDLDLDGAGIVADSGSWHHIPAEELDEVTGDLRIPGVEVEASCGALIEPLHAELIFDDAQSARKSDYNICSDCKPSITSYPDEKFERTGY